MHQHVLDPRARRNAMPIPFRSKLGLVFGTGALVLCGMITTFSLVGLVKSSVRANRLGSYSELIR